MPSDGYAVIGVAGSRSEWLRSLARWSTSATIPVEFMACLSTHELVARLGSGRRYSAALIEHKAEGLDRDLLALVRKAGCAAIVVGGSTSARWEAMGASAVGEDLSPDSLMALLRTVATPIERWDPWAELEPAAPASPGREPGVVITLCGPGGTGVSTLAMAAAQGLTCGDGGVVLCDLARRAQQGMLHDTYDVRPALPELVDAHRMGSMTPTEVVDATFFIKERGYSLLLGIRHPSAWVTLRPRALDAALTSLRSAFPTLVIDADLDLEGASNGGSMDVEERNGASRAAVGQADVVVVVGNPGMKGLHSLVGAIAEVIAFGAEPARILPVLNRSPRSRLGRAEIVSAYSKLIGEIEVPRIGLDDRGGTPQTKSSASEPQPLVFVPDRSLERALRDVTPLPERIVTPLCKVIRGARANQGEQPREQPSPKRIIPGTLGHWDNQGDLDVTHG